MRLSIVMPAHNEQENLLESIKRIEEVVRVEHELVVVNDHSTDKTCQIVLESSHSYANLRLVDNTDAAGFANALKCGFRNARYEVVVPVMADLCDDLDTINMMFAKIAEGYDVVCGARYIKGGSRLGGSKVKAFFSSFVGRSLNIILGLPTHDVANAFKMYRKTVLDAVDIRATSFELSMEILLKAYYRRFKITEVPTVWKERTRGKSSFKMFKLVPNYFRFYLWAILKKVTG